jgi:hypothetical protein
MVDAGGVIKEARDLIEDYGKAEFTTFTVSDGGQDLTIPAVVQGTELHILRPSEIEDWRTRPRFRAGTASLLTVESLIEHVNRFKDDDSVLFANNDRASPTITAILDYHPKGATAAPRFGKHRAHYAFPLSDEWIAWHASNGLKRAMPMAEFAEFLEDRIVDVIVLIPDEDSVPEELQKFINSLGGVDTIATPNKLMELSRGLQVYEDSALKQAVKLSSGEGELSFEVTHRDQDGKPLKVPSLFLIAIPVFKNGPLYRIAARLRYRKGPEGVIFWYDLWRSERSFDDAFNEGCERVEVETGLPLLLGKPE